MQGIRVAPTTLETLEQLFLAATGQAGVRRPDRIAELAAAFTLHRNGGCGDAALKAEQAWKGWRHQRGREDLRGLPVALGYAMILTGCARFTEADRVVAEVRYMITSHDSQAFDLIEPTLDRVMNAIARGHEPHCARQENFRLS